MDHNEILLKEVYYPNVYTDKYPKKRWYTAKEAGMFPERWAYFLSVNEANGETIEQVLEQYFTFVS